MKAQDCPYALVEKRLTLAVDRVATAFTVHARAAGTPLPHGWAENGARNAAMALHETFTEDAEQIYQLRGLLRKVTAVLGLQPRDLLAELALLVEIKEVLR